jgi:GLPGLI family protein
MRYFLVILVVFFHNTILCQSILGTYEVKYGQNTYQNELIVNDTISIWRDIQDKENPSDIIFYLIKNRKNDNMLLNDMIFNKLFFILDSLHSMKWVLNNDSAQILNYICNSASTTFRGRQYTAFYSKSIPISNGPWKFGGLPGLILAIQSTDLEYSFTAKKISITDEKIIYPFKQNQNFLKWNDYTNEFKKVIDNTIKLLKSKASSDDSNGRFSLKLDAPEIIYPEVQLGNGKQNN